MNLLFRNIFKFKIRIYIILNYFLWIWVNFYKENFFFRCVVFFNEFFVCLKCIYRRIIYMGYRFIKSKVLKIFI